MANKDEVAEVVSAPEGVDDLSADIASVVGAVGTASTFTWLSLPDPDPDPDPARARGRAAVTGVLFRLLVGRFGFFTAIASSRFESVDLVKS